jgi:hypothetical protein
MKNDYILIKYLKEIETEDGAYYNDLDEIAESDNPYSIVKEKRGSSWSGSSTPIRLEKLESIIKELKKLGATHVEIMYHEDHCSYVFNGVNIRKPTEEEINSYEKEKNKEIGKGMDIKIDYMERQLKSLKEKREKLKTN